MVEVSDRLLLEKAKPNPSLVEEALSFNAADLHIISDEKLRQYIVVLGQYLITLQYEENKISAICSAWHKALDNHVYSVLCKSNDPYLSKKITLAEKRAWALENDEHALSLNEEFEISDSKKSVIHNMHQPVEQYINTLKKEIDARENEKKRFNH